MKHILYKNGSLLVIVICMYDFLGSNLEKKRFNMNFEDGARAANNSRSSDNGRPKFANVRTIFFAF